MANRYDDIMSCPRHISSRRAPMPLQDRAAQFAPFAALTGYEAVIRETGRLTQSRAELTESAKVALNEKLQLLLRCLHARPVLSVTFFQEDERKAGGAYITVTGCVKKLDPYERKLIFTDGTQVYVEAVTAIEFSDN